MSDELRGYDAWKTTPPEDETEECPECKGTGTVKVAGPDEFGNYDTDECPRCQGDGYVDPPSEEDIAERRADEMLSDPDFNRQTGRYDY